MPITSFRLEKDRAIKLAECQQVPSIMIISGANGVGKSTLLYALKAHRGVQGSGTFLYIAPHRAWSRQKIRAMYLLAKRTKWTEMIGADSMLGIDGLSLRGGTRRFDFVDESPSAIKHLLGQIEVRRQQIIAAMYDMGTLDKGNFPDVYGPLRRLVNYLLPHLKFERVDLSTLDDVKCIFSLLHHPSGSGYLQVDIDELSSGEREVIMLFLTFIEQQILRSLSKFDASISPSQDLVMLVDTPELHLHPELQSRLLEYLRDIVREEGIQFIMTTHSPVLINEARYEELYVLTMPENIDGYNQLQKVTTTPERLEALRSISGETFRLTAGRSLVLVEGEAPFGDEPSDKRLLEIMDPGFTKYVLIPFRNKERVREVVKELSSSDEVTSIGLQLFAILDRDRETGRDIEGERVFLWPVCSIENFLLSPSAIWQVVAPYKEKLGWSGTGDVLRELEGICKGQIDEEIDMRIAKDPESAHSAVNKIVSEKRELELFSGKRVLKKFYSKIGSIIGMRYQTFCYTVAQKTAETAVPEGIIRIRKRIDNYVPLSLGKDLSEILMELQGLQPESGLISPMKEAIALTEKAAKEVESGSQAVVDRNDLKKRLWVTLGSLKQNPPADAKLEFSSKIESALMRTMSIRVS